MQMTSMQRASMEQILRQAIVAFEPRILPRTLEVEVVLDGYAMDSHNQAGMLIRGMLWAQPVPLELMLRTDVDLETGRIAIREVTR